MKEKGSRIASEIITDWNYERYLRSLYRTKKRFEEEDKKKKEEQNSIK